MKVILCAACVAAAIAAAGPALAEHVAQPAGPIGHMNDFRGAPSALPRVIHRAEALTGGEVVEARFARRGGKPGFDVLVAKGGRLLSVRLERFDAGAVQTIAVNARPDWMLKWTQRADIRTVRRARIPLDEAVRTAEHAAAGPAVAAGVARGDVGGASLVKAYNVLIEYRDGHTRRVAVDAQTGQIITDPNALTDWP